MLRFQLGLFQEMLQVTWSLCRVSIGKLIKFASCFLLKIIPRVCFIFKNFLRSKYSTQGFKVYFSKLAEAKYSFIVHHLVNASLRPLLCRLESLYLCAFLIKGIFCLTVEDILIFICPAGFQIRFWRSRLWDPA